MENDDIFYSSGWKQTNTMTIALYPQFDVMIDKEYFSLIKVPKYISLMNQKGLIISLTVGLGIMIGALTGLISKDYKKNIFIKIPLNDLKGHIVIDKNKFTLTYDNKVIVLSRNMASFRPQKSQKGEFELFEKYIEKYIS